MTGIFSLQTKSGECIRYDIRCSAEVFTGSFRQVHDAGKTVVHLLCIPSSHGHVGKGFGRFRCGELRFRAHLLGFFRQSVKAVHDLSGIIDKSLCGGTRNCFHLGHSCLEIHTDLCRISADRSDGAGCGCQDVLRDGNGSGPDSFDLIYARLIARCVELCIEL